MKKKLFIVCALAFNLTLMAQTTEQREIIQASYNKDDLQKTSNQIATYSLAKEKRVTDYLVANPAQKKSFDKNGVAYLLYDIGADGNPIFINTKDNAQIDNTKASSLYMGGSMNVNVTGTNMVAGVWDGGQVNPSHEALLGQVTMQPNQTISSAGGNDHQTACTAIMVGKNINDKRGIAFDATTKNYDWDDDLVEMNAFSNLGFLISNHSYGYANNNTIPVWQFGAYDDVASAWDSLLKTKTFFLPFIAAGNEQASNGNQSKAGFDIITGSSACKNAVTVGAIDADNSMSNYSNWGPTDDGRVKPDIVTLGTNIDVPLYNSNNAYTGAVTASSGTSYAAPAAAAGALLLQQYYFSLKGAYMQAPMLRALILHSADDAGNPGPDAKFGWGILNLERAAQIIKQSVPNFGAGGSIMQWVITNPTNDSLSEEAISLNYATGDAKASICWADDEGSTQVESAGVDNTTNRMVYQFDIKMRRQIPFTQPGAYKNLSISNPNAVATLASNWFDGTNNNYLQANISGNTIDDYGTLYFRKKSTSPAAIRPFAVIVTGLKVTALSNDTFENNEALVFYDKNSSKIKLISNDLSQFGNYKVYDISGKSIQEGNSNTNEIEIEKFASNGIYIIKFENKGKNVSLKFIK